MARRSPGASALVTGLVTGLAAALIAPVALPAQAGAAGRDGLAPETLRGRAGQLLAGDLDGRDAHAPKAARKVAVDATGRAAPTSTSTSGSGSRAADGAPLTAAPSASLRAASTACVPDELWTTTLGERSVVHASSAGAASITVQRKREYGVWRTIGSAARSSVVVNDTTVNQRAVYTYRLVAKRADGVVVRDCVTEDYQGTWTRDGWGTVDAVVATSGGLYQQGESDQGVRAGAGSWVTPTFSRDGRLYAATRLDPTAGHPVLEVRRAATAATVFTVDLKAGVMPADPAFSFDGQTLAFSRYDDQGEPLGLGFVDVFGAHTVRTVRTEPASAEPAWRPDGSLVVSTFGTDDDGLGTLCATCSTVTPLAGTSGGYTAAVAKDGTTWFTTDDGNRSALKRRAPNGAVSTVRSSPTDSFISPRLTADGSLFVERDVPDAPSSDTYAVGVHRVAVGGAANGDDDVLTAIGWEDANVGLHGYDVRQLQSKGTSNRTAEGHHDLIARDANGTLWAYRNTGFELTGRTGIGSGWGIYNAVVSVGDMTGDDQADLVARDSAGTLWLYRGQLTWGGFLPRTRLGTGWSAYTLVGAGDWNGDGLADLVARDGRGVLWLYPGTGRGTLAPRQQIGTGWSQITAIVASGDADFDGRTDLLARDSAGRLFLYPGNGRGGFLPRRQLGTGWAGFTSLSVTEVTYGRAQVWARTANGDLRGYDLYADGSFVPGEWWSEGGGWKTFLLTA